MYKAFDPKLTNQLTLIRHGWTSPEYELVDNQNSYGKLRYNWLSRRTAYVEAADTRWVFHQDFLSRTVSICNENGVVLGEAWRGIFSRRTVLRMRTGFTAEFYRPLLFSREYVWDSEQYGDIMHIRHYPLMWKQQIEVGQSTTPPEMIPLLIFLGAHLTILRIRRRAAH